MLPDDAFSIILLFLKGVVYFGSYRKFMKVSKSHCYIVAVVFGKDSRDSPCTKLGNSMGC